MSTEVLVAMIAAGAALTGSVVGLVAASISARQSARSAIDLERIRNELARKQDNKSVVDGEFARALEALAICLQAIQRLKDELQMVVSATEGTLDADVAIARVSQASEELVRAYSEQYSHLCKNEECLLHRAKNIAHSIRVTVHSELSSVRHASQLAEGARVRCIAFRAELSDIQNSIRDSRTERIASRIE